jgi:hypothetical protein
MMPDNYADALTKAVERATEVLAYRLLLEIQRGKITPIFLGTADLQGLASDIASEYTKTLKLELDNADNVLRFGGGGPPE